MTSHGCADPSSEQFYTHAQQLLLQHRWYPAALMGVMRARLRVQYQGQPCSRGHLLLCCRLVSKARSWSRKQLTEPAPAAWQLWMPAHKPGLDHCLPA